MSSGLNLQIGVCNVALRALEGAMELYVCLCCNIPVKRRQFSKVTEETYKRAEVESKERRPPQKGNKRNLSDRSKIINAEQGQIVK